MAGHHFPPGMRPLHMPSLSSNLIIFSSGMFQVNPPHPTKCYISAVCQQLLRLFFLSLPWSRLEGSHNHTKRQFQKLPLLSWGEVGLRRHCKAPALSCSLGSVFISRLRGKCLAGALISTSSYFTHAQCRVSRCPSALSAQMRTVRQCSHPPRSQQAVCVGLPRLCSYALPNDITLLKNCYRLFFTSTSGSYWKTTWWMVDFVLSV